MDTRTPRTPTGGSPAGSYDSQAVLSAVKVPSDPAQVIVNNVSFRVRLATPGGRGRPLPASHPPPRSSPARGRRLVSAARPPASLSAPPSSAGPTGSGGSDGLSTPRRTASHASGGPIADIPIADIPAARGARRRAPVVWTGRAMPGDIDAGQLLRAVPRPGPSPLSPTSPGATSRLPREESTTATTQVLPRFDADPNDPPTLVVPRVPEPSAPLDGAPGRPRTGSPYGLSEETGTKPHDGATPTRSPLPAENADSRRPGGRSRREDVQAYFPGRRMNLGIVLLPLRVFLGFISLYAGMGKLTDPVYFDGGERGSMVTWLRGLEPWTIASPLHDFAVAHPVGAGLTVAFGQVIVGVLTIFGLWQRAAAALGALLSAALLVTVSWNTVAAYDAPDIIYLAAWSPLVIAGAPVYSLDARLAGEAWRTLGPRSRVVDLRRRVVRRGALLVTLLVGLALLIGSILGGAVRSAQVATVPEPGETPRNHLPGSPVPKDPRTSAPPNTGEPSAGPTAGRSASPSEESSTTPEQRSPGGETGEPGQPSQDQTVQAPPQQEEQAPPQPEAPAPTTGGGDRAPSGDGGSTGGEPEPEDGADGGGSSSRGALGGLLG